MLMASQMSTGAGAVRMMTSVPGMTPHCVESLRHINSSVDF